MFALNMENLENKTLRACICPSECETQTFAMVTRVVCDGFAAASSNMTLKAWSEQCERPFARQVFVFDGILGRVSDSWIIPLQW